MALTPWEPLSEVTTLWQAMDRLFAESFIDVGSERMTAGMVPIDLVERDDALVVTASMPGVKPEDVDVSVHRNMLVIRGEMHGESGQNGGRYHRRERWQGNFSRQVTLPVEVDADACDASFKDGVLTITLPKSEQARAKRIEIRGPGPVPVEGGTRSTPA
jgi:HSP20 family protein